MLFENDIVIEDGINYKWGGGGGDRWINIILLYLFYM